MAVSLKVEYEGLFKYFEPYIFKKPIEKWAAAVNIELKETDVNDVKSYSSSLINKEKQIESSVSYFLSSELAQDEIFNVIK